jgi:hypothetical protein
MIRNEHMTNDIPQCFNEAFLSWFRECTEETWRNYQTKTFEEFVVSGIGRRDWQQGTRWLNGLSDQQITTIEQRYDMSGLSRGYFSMSSIMMYGRRAGE